MCELCKVPRTYPPHCMGEGGRFDEDECEWWDREIGRPTNTDIERRHEQDRRMAIMERKLRELCTKSVILDRYYLAR
jgi:hypothetical protein